jgi:U11/U12 small nuclear ribonucleoprotein SNRNP31
MSRVGHVIRVTIVKDKETRESKGVAFILYVDRTSAHRAITALNRKELFGRTIKCSVAHDNGRAAEFIRRKTYKDKTRCYECGDYGHLSFECPKNILGDRAQPEKKKKKKKAKAGLEEASGSGGGARESDQEDEEEEFEDDWSLGDAIRHCQYMREREDPQSTSDHTPFTGTQRKQLKQDSYFSDEDASD